MKAQEFRFQNAECLVDSENNTGNTVYVIRHSKRDEITNPMDHKKVLLNTEGILMAQKWGESLSQEFDKIMVYSSPVERCIQTAKCILEVFNEYKEVFLSDMLGEPGPFIYGNAWKSFERFGTIGVVERLEKGEALPYIRNEAEGVRNFLNYMRSEANKTDANTALVFITHDACIAPIINFFTGEYFCKDHWIEYLGGLKFQFNNSSLTIQRI